MLDTRKSLCMLLLLLCSRRIGTSAFAPALGVFNPHCLPSSRPSTATVLFQERTTDKQTIRKSTASASTSSFPNFVLKRNHQSKSFRNGNQLVFPRSIAESYGAESGTLVHVHVKGKDQTADVAIGYGVYNPNSLYRVRMLNHRFLQPQLYQSLCDAVDVDQAWSSILEHHIEAAILQRRAIGLPNSSTDTYRLINGEGDSLSGLAVDVISNHLVVMSSASWTEQHRAIVEKSLAKAFPDFQLHWKTAPLRLKQDGYEMQEGVENADDCNDTSGDAEMVLSKENGLLFETYPSGDGQKTGVYCDQRENRQTIAQLCRHKRVLDLCCFTGGFALHAAAAGAASCVGVDSSAAAIGTCQKNAVRNNLQETVSFVQSDITVYMQSAEEQFDVVILDPPKLAPSNKMLEKAKRKYHALNRDAINLVDSKGGLLLTCTCSAAMTQEGGGEFFLKMVQAAALAAGKQVTVLSVAGAAPCHTRSPISFPASAYLTAALFYVHPK